MKINLLMEAFSIAHQRGQHDIARLIWDACGREEPSPATSVASLVCKGRLTMSHCPLCNRSLDAITSTELLRAAASIAPPLRGPLNVQVIEAAFLLTCMIDIEITRLAATPADRDRMLGLVAEHIEQRMGQAA